MKILIVQSFNDKFPTHGGTRRSLQIKEEIMRFYCCDQIKFSEWGKITFGWFYILIPFLLLRNMPLLVLGLSIKGLLRYCIYGANVYWDILKYKPDQVAIETTPGNAMMLANLVMRTKLPYIVFPHNIEFLVNGQCDDSFYSVGKAFSWEVDIYRNASKVFCISSFDKDVLASLGIDSLLFLYYPTVTELERFQLIKKSRSSSSRLHGLIVGSVSNAPTRNGVTLMISMLQKQYFSYKHVIVGYGSEIFKGSQNENLIIEGGVSNERLDSLLIGAKYVLLWQLQTSGFLTRLIELNIAGVPIFIMGHYAQVRGLEKYGIFLIDSVADIKEDLFNDKNFEFFTRQSIADLIR